MNWEAIGAIAETLGAVAVLVTLIYLSRQIRESNMLSKSTAAKELMNAFGEVNSMMCEPSFAAALSKSKAKTYDFTPAEEVQLSHLCLRLCNAYLQAETAYKNGHLDEENFAVVKRDVRAHLNTYPGNATYFQWFLDEYPDVSDWEIVKGMRRVLRSRADV